MSALSPDIAAKIRASFARQGLMASFGATLARMEAGRVDIAADVAPAFSQQQGFAHAGMVFALGDSAAGYAALSVMPLEAEVLTVEMKINLMAPAAGRLLAEGRVLKAGRRLVIVAADVWSEGGDGARKQVAALQGTMIPVAA
ncbi:PaaI family thioesterase [Abyssibius alkaniclasticus]|uniref:PaaI family thioesterase n=1 Tax=Abyssibius alkaniclasticus TaxID=2881234 RepID=UPI0040586834